MNKKVLIGIIVAILVIIAVVVGVVIISHHNTKNNDLSAMNGSENDNMLVGEDDEQNNQENTNKNESKTLVVYYSAQNHTKAVAEKIAQNLNADIFEIEPEEKYSEEDLNWTNRNSRVSKEHDDESLRNIKNVYLFSTNGGSGLSGTVSTITNKLSGANVNSNAFKLHRIR